MTTTVVHGLKGFHMHYRMYVVERRLEILLLFFFFFYKIFLHINETERRQFKEENSSNQKQIFLTNLEHGVSGIHGDFKQNDFFIMLIRFVLVHYTLF
jgi:hypothetical protein